MAMRSRGHNERRTDLGHLLAALNAIGKYTQSKCPDIAIGLFFG